MSEAEGASGGAAAATPEGVIRRLIDDLEQGSWFAALGEPATPGEVQEVAAYLEALGFADRRSVWLASWPAAREACERADWDRSWWQHEQALQAALYAQARERYGEMRLLRVLTELTEAATRLLHGPAAVAAARAGSTDAGLIRAAAGAAAQASYQAGLCRVLGASTGHAFATKLRLFEAGRWPLTIVPKRFFIF